MWIPSVCTQDGFSESVARTKGVHVRDLQPLTTLRIETQNTVYRLTIIDPASSTVVILAGPSSIGLMQGRIEGSSFGGCLLKQGCILRGMRLELRLANERTILTSAIRQITIEPPTESPTQS